VTFGGIVSTLSTGSTSLSGPVGVVVDASGNVYIADTGNNEIVKIAPDGTSSVLTITGLTSPSTLTAPKGLAIDGSGNLFIADSGNSRIVVVGPTGSGSVLSTGAVSLNAPQGLAIDAAGNIFIADTGNNQIVEAPATGTPAVYAITGLSSPSTLSSPKGLAEDVSGNLYIADAGNSRIVKVTSGGVGSTLAITGTTPTTPIGVAVDDLGALYIADSTGNRIIAVTTGLAGTNFSDTYGLTIVSPAGVAVDVFGNVFVADTGNNHIDSVQPNSVGYGRKQLGTATGKNFVLPFIVQSGVSLTTLGIYTQGYTFGVSSTDFTTGSGGSNPCVAQLYSSTTTCTIAIKFLPGAPGLGQGGMILTYTASGTTKTLTVPLYGFADAPQAALSPGAASKMSTGASVSLGTPYQIAVDGSGVMYVGDSTGNQVVRISAAGGSATVVSAGSHAFGSVKGVALDGVGELFIADSSNNKIIEISAGGLSSELTVTAASSSISGPTALATDVAGNLYIADNGNNRIVKVRPPDVAASTASLTGTVVNTGRYTFSGSTITGLAVDWADNLYIVDQNANKIIKVTPAGANSEVAFPGLTLSKPQGVAVDGFGNVYVSDAGNNRIVQLISGVASEVAVQGLTSPSTLGSGASDLFGVSVDSSGNIYIADSANSRVVKVTVSRASLAFASTQQGATSSDSPKTAQVTNLGNQSLVFSANPTYTTSFIENTDDTNLCTSSTSLSPGTLCDVSVKFTPQSVGLLSPNITLTNNNLNVASATQRVAVSGTGLTAGDTTVTAVTVSPSPLTNGETATISAVVSDTSSGHSATVPAGSVSFVDTVGSTGTSLNGGAGAALSGGTATLTGVLLSGIGTHTITATYAGASGSFLTSSNTTTVALNRAPVTITGPATQPVPLAIGQAGSVAVTVAGSYTTIAPPSGSVTYSILDASSSTVASGTATLTAGSTDATASVPTPSSLVAGDYTISVSYDGDSNYAASGTATTISAAVGKVTPTVSWAQPAALTYGTSLSGVLSAAAVNGSTGVAGSFTYTATPQGGSAGLVTATSVLGAGSYSLTATFTPTDGTTYASASGTVSLSVGKATPAIALTSSSNPALLSNSITLTATVSSSVSTPGGSVNFYDGTTLLGSAALAQGVATYATAALTVGEHSVTAAYGGDSNFVTLTSSALAQTVDDFTLAVASGGVATATVAPGGTATYQMTLGPSAGSTFPAAVALTSSGAPAGSTVTITPQTIAAGASATNVTIAIQVPATAAALQRTGTWVFAVSVPLLGMFLFSTGGTLRRRGVPVFLLLMALVSVGFLVGCAESPRAITVVPPRNYTVTITATSGTVSHSTTVTLTVTP
jgi:sugar lactone lactonase YvrE